MLRDSYPYYLANRPAAANTDLIVTSKYTGGPPVDDSRRKRAK